MAGAREPTSSGDLAGCRDENNSLNGGGGGE